MDADRKGQLLAAAMQVSPEGSLLDRVVTGAASLLRAACVTSALLTEDGASGVVASTNARGRAAFDLEFELGEGPGTSAFSTDTEMLVGDMSSAAQRWPAFSTEALARGVAAVFAFPARIGAIRVGVMVVHRDRAGAMEPAGLADARVFAEICSTLMIDAQAGLDADTTLATGWPRRAVVHQATGMAAVQLGVPLPVALARLRAYAFAEGRLLDDVATDIVERRLRIEP